MQILLDFYKNALELLFPNECQECSELMDHDELLCKNCLLKFPALSTVKIESKGFSLEVASKFAYHNLAKKFITGKYYGNLWPFEKAGKILHTAQGFPINPDQAKDWIIVSVPLHWTRKISRGFNQSEILAEELSKVTGAKLENILKRNRRTVFQATTWNAASRKENVSGAFELIHSNFFGPSLESLKLKLLGKNILLVDDLLTTGSTLVECAKVLKRELKPAQIFAITLCRS